MIDLNNLQNIREIINEFFEKTGFDIETEILSLEDKTIPIKIKTEEPKVLIGQNGQTLADIQHLLKAILSHQIPEQFYIDLDINDYKKKKIEYLRQTAKEWADEVSLNKKEKIMTPMPAYERRIVHLELADREDITTESMGEGLERRIIIRPCL
jgi:spoIIIJ-associated protein